ncbi:MAG TPA: metallophosphoesterase [Kofleriaceae bacterium]|nr:metallophosphoesterase [Kofleriaceae bacterium]
MTRGVAIAVAAALVAAGACDRRRAHDERPAPPAAPAAAAPGCTIAPLALRLPAPRRLVAIGDLHGDLGGARAALRAAGAIDDRDRWIGGDLVVVQTGDVLDRGDDERALLDLLGELEVQARAAGGALVLLLGNHELMNAAGDFRYVTPAGLHAFDDVAAAEPPGEAGAGSPDVPAAMRSRLAALGAGHRYAHRLAGRAVIAIVGDAVFSHAGVLGGWVRRVDEVNRAARCWMDGQASERPAALTSSDSPVWTRAVGGPAVDCAQVSEALAGLGVARMVVGHTVQAGGISSACDGAVWRIDVGLAKHYGGPIEVLELTPGAPPRVLHGVRG